MTHSLSFNMQWWRHQMETYYMYHSSDWGRLWSTLHWRHNDHDGVSNHKPHGYLLNRIFGRRSKKTSKLRVTGLCAGNSPGTGEFPAQRASNTENVSIWWRHHQIMNSKQTSHISLSRASYGVSIVNIWERNVPVIMAPHCVLVSYMLCAKLIIGPSVRV